MAADPRINGDRLWSSIMETARFGATPNGGIKRLTLTKEDVAVRQWFKEQSETLGCKVIVDEVANMFAIRPGKRSGIDPIAMGSHLDTQPTGGKFDGVLGVLGGLEALRTIVESGLETNAPIAVVNWSAGSALGADSLWERISIEENRGERNQLSDCQRGVNKVDLAISRGGAILGEGRVALRHALTTITNHV